MAEKKINLTVTNEGLILRAGDDAWSLTAAEIDRMITIFSGYRAKAVPPVPETMPFQTEGLPIDDPIWVAGRDAMTGNVLLSVRHPGLSWLSFSFPKDEALEISRMLARIAKTNDTSTKPN